MADASETFPPLRLAVLGAGTFANAAWAPLLNSFAAKGKLVVTRVWSRSEASAKALSEVLDPAPLVSSFSFSFGEQTLDAVLRSDDVDAVLSILPVQAMPDVTRRALSAGKAVLQEKPVAGTVAGALETLAVAREVAEVAAKTKNEEEGKENKASTIRPVFCLAENYRSESGVLAAAAAAKQIVAPSKITTITLAGNMPMDSKNRYSGSKWRRDPEGCPGCFLMDSCVHFVAALRAVAAAAGAGEPTRVGARAASRCVRGGDNDLPSPDTLCGFLEFENGSLGTVSVTFAGATPRFALTVDGRGGAVELSRGGYGGSVGGGAAGRGAGYNVALSPKDGEASTEFHPFAGLERELESFVRLARGRGSEADATALSPASAARDLSLIEALLASSADGGSPKEVQKIGREVDPLEMGFGVA